MYSALYIFACFTAHGILPLQDDGGTVLLGHGDLRFLPTSGGGLSKMGGLKFSHILRVHNRVLGESSHLPPPGRKSCPVGSSHHIFIPPPKVHSPHPLNNNFHAIYNSRKTSFLAVVIASV